MLYLDMDAQQETRQCIGCMDDTIGNLMCCNAPCCIACFEQWLEQSSFCMHCRRQIDLREERRPRTDVPGLEDGEIPFNADGADTEEFYQDLIRAAQRYMPPGLDDYQQDLFRRGFAVGTINGITLTDTIIRLSRG